MELFEDMVHEVIDENTLVGFGKHKNKTFKELYDNEPGYCLWLLNLGGKRTKKASNLYMWLKETYDPEDDPDKRYRYEILRDMFEQ